VKLAPRISQFRVTMRMIAARLERAVSSAIAWRVFPWVTRFAFRVVELFVVSCVVELAMTLPMAVYFHRITIFALPVNLVILPLLVVLMPAALVTLLALAVWPAAAVVPAAVVAVVLHFGVGLVRLFGSMALGDFRIPGPLVWQSAVFIGLLAAAIVLAHWSLAHAIVSWSGWAERMLNIPQRLKPSLLHRIIGRVKFVPIRIGDGRRLRYGAWATLMLAALAAVMPRPVERPHGALLVEAIDVGQGDSLLVITPDGKTLLVDGGGFGGGSRQAAQDFDIGEEVVSPALWARGIRHLDAVALSHAHSDHMGGLPAVLRNFHPDELWVGNNPRFDAYEALLDQAAALHIKVKSFRAGDGFEFGNAQVRVLAPFRDYVPGDAPANNDSLVLHVANGATSVMLEGDAEAPIEEEMLAESGLESTLLKVGHHGSVTSTRPEFFARVAPRWAVISCGLRNRYGHPREEVLEELQAARVQTFRTDIHGASCFVLDGKVARASECAGGEISP
jgi:competence protein ComEC